MADSKSTSENNGCWTFLQLVAGIILLVMLMQVLKMIGSVLVLGWVWGGWILKSIGLGLLPWVTTTIVNSGLVCGTLWAARRVHTLGWAFSQATDVQDNGGVFSRNITMDRIKAALGRWFSPFCAAIGGVTVCQLWLVFGMLNNWSAYDLSFNAPDSYSAGWITKDWLMFKDQLPSTSAGALLIYITIAIGLFASLHFVWELAAWFINRLGGDFIAQTQPNVDGIQVSYRSVVSLLSDAEAKLDQSDSDEEDLPQRRDTLQKIRSYIESGAILQLIAQARWKQAEDFVDKLRQKIEWAQLSRVDHAETTILGAPCPKLWTPTERMSAIRPAYKKKMFTYHPDRNPSPNAPEMAKRINEAYDYLKKKFDP